MGNSVKPSILSRLEGSAAGDWFFPQINQAGIFAENVTQITEGFA